MALTPPEPNAVYILNCITDATVEPHEARAKSKLGHVPSWVYAAYHSDKLCYVGATSDIVNRIKAHSDDGTDAAVFTSIFPPSELSNVYWFEKYSKAARREKQLARSIKADNPSWFVWQA